MAFNLSFDEMWLQNSGIYEMLTDQDLLDGFEHKVDVLFVSGTSAVNIDLLGIGCDVQELLLNVFDGRAILFASLVFGEAPTQIDLLDLGLEQILLVEEEDDGGVLEPGAVDQIAEQGQGFVHALDVGVFSEAHVVLGEGHEEDDGRHVHEAMEPLATLGAL